MKVVYISDDGRDENSGRTREEAVRSWERARSLVRSDVELRLVGSSTVRRFTKEFEEKERRQIYSKSDWG